MNNVWLALITGLTTGGLSCFAVQGGLLATAVSEGRDKNTKVVMFIISKLIAYTILGALLGLLGSSLAISPKLQGWLQIFAGVFMLATAARILDLHPVFRYLTIEPPKWALRLARNESRSRQLFAPAILGFLTVLLPCGTTQAMMVLAASAASPFWGSAILGSFVLGTTPVFFGLGIASSEIFRRPSLKYLAVVAVTFLGILSINTGQALRGSIHTLQNYWKVAFNPSIRGASVDTAAPLVNGKQEATVYITASGYSSPVKSLKAGIPVNLKIIAQNARGCVRAFTIPEYNISRVLPVNGSEEIEFTPTKPGRLAYTCSMGMYTGSFQVVP